MAVPHVSARSRSSRHVSPRPVSPPRPPDRRDRAAGRPAATSRATVGGRPARRAPRRRRRRP
ncbi:hypothetical protein BRD18_06915 [Halobacteriales archaeon SW_7_71_33]|nr:MAG: hypothetical protein BRD18_06915 [Halobacteriales archaeon SW_7_71_33]